MKQATLQFNRTELWQLWWYCQQIENEGYYYDKKSHFEKRHQQIKLAIAHALKYENFITLDEYEKMTGIKIKHTNIDS